MVFTLFCFFLKSYVFYQKSTAFCPFIDAGINAGSLGPTCGLIAGRKPNGFHNFVFFFKIVRFLSQIDRFVSFLLMRGLMRDPRGQLTLFRFLSEIVRFLFQIGCFLSFLLMRPTCGLIAGRKPYGFHTFLFFSKIVRFLSKIDCFLSFLLMRGLMRDPWGQPAG